MSTDAEKQYWNDRFEALEKSTYDETGKYISDISDAIDHAFSTIDKEIKALYQQYAKDNKMSLADAQQYLQNSDVKEFKADVRDYIKMAESGDKQFTQQLDALSARARISRLEALKARAAMEIHKAYDKQSTYISGACENALQHNYLVTAYDIQTGKGKYEPFDKLDSKSIKRALSNPWTADNKTFSDRVWTNREQLVHTVHQEMTRGFVSGVDAAGMTKSIQSRMGVAKYAAERLVRTETAYFASLGSHDSYDDCDVAKYQILATLDNRTSDICQDMDGQIFDLKDFAVGETAPPFHPYCRTTTIPVIEDSVIEEKRSARGDDGKTYEVPGEITYKDWESQYVDGNDDEE
jgi:SPP1 gp7 family putative phage head morphogenesis protein